MDNQTLNTGTSSTSTKRYYSLNGTSSVDTVFTFNPTTGILTYAVNSGDTGGGSPTAWSKVGFNTSNSSDGTQILAGDTIYLVQSSGSVNNGYFTVGADWVTEIQDNVKYTKGTTTYDAGKASIITVPDTGTYDAQLKKSGVFSLKSATVPATSSSGLYTWAFHHGNFDNAYGDGDILTARDNGRFYADTPAYTSASIGTITGSKGVPGTSTQYPNGGWLTSGGSQGASINNNGFITRFFSYYNGTNSTNYQILDNDDTTYAYLSQPSGADFSYYNNSEKVYIEKVYVDWNTGQPSNNTLLLKEYANDTSTVTSTTSINSRDSSIFKVINSRNVWEITGESKHYVNLLLMLILIA